jgi:hypothetical protein
MLPALLALALEAGAVWSAPPPAPGKAATPVAAASGSPAPAATAGGPVILFLVDNSASLPPLDPNEKRVAALEKMFTFLSGQRYRLVLFGGRREVFVDDASKYRNDGQWTDFYHAFAKAREIASGYPKGTDVRMVLLTDAIPDPDPADWASPPPGWDARSESVRRTVELVGAMKIPLYVVLVGGAATPGDGAAGDAAGTDGPRAGMAPSPGFVLDMVRAANGQAAAPLAQTVASFFADDGMLLRRFVYRVQPHEGLQRIEPVVRRIAAPARPTVELRILSYVVLPLVLVVLGLLGLLVRSFPGPGDVEIIELAANQPVHVAADRIHRASDGTWSDQGLSLTSDARHAAGTFTLQIARLDAAEACLDTAGLDERDAALLALPLEELRRALESATDAGSRDEKIHALNLDYAARSLQPEEVARVVAGGAERTRIPAIDFVRAKVRLAFDDPLRQKLLEPRVQAVTYGRAGTRQDVAVGGRVRLGRYGFVVRDLEKGGRKDARLVLCYARVPSLLGLKTVLPSWLQGAFRFRRSGQRHVC